MAPLTSQPSNLLRPTSDLRFRSTQAHKPPFSHTELAWTPNVEPTLATERDGRWPVCSRSALGRAVLTPRDPTLVDQYRALASFYPQLACLAGCVWGVRGVCGHRGQALSSLGGALRILLPYVFLLG